MIAIDSDVLAVHHIFQNSPRFESTEKFFAKIKGQTKAITIFNLLDLAGIIASANQAKKSQDIFEKYLRSDNVAVLFPALTSGDAKHFWQSVTSESFARIQRGMRLGDAAILWTLETNENIEAFITWNTKHFKSKTDINVLTPAEF